MPPRGRYTYTPDSAIDHGSIGGLTDDDHTQYLLADGTRNLAGAWNLGGYAISNIGNITTGGIFSDGTLSISSGSITSGVNATFSGTLTVDTDTLVVNPFGFENKVGMGTAAPQNPLHLYGSSAGDITLKITNAEGAGSTTETVVIQATTLADGVGDMGKIVFGRVGDYVLEADADSYIKFYTADGNIDVLAMTIDESQDITATGSFEATTLTDGIATITGGAITGTTLNLTSNSISFSGSTMLTNPGTQNVVLGIGADVGSSRDSTYIGYNAGGTGNSTGGFNTFIGSYAGEDVSSGASNALFGYGAGIQLTTGSYNVAVGASLQSATTTIKNMAIGYTALNAVTTTTGSDNNVGIGYQAGLRITGARNLAIGTGALHNMAAGSNNVGIGYRALYGKTSSPYGSGSNNVGIGMQALSSITNLVANSNTAIGYFAGENITGGDNNVLIGYRAGDVLTTGIQNICIGYGIDPSGVGVSYELNIGDLIKGYLSAHGSGPAVHFMGGTPQGQQAHIADAVAAAGDPPTQAEFNAFVTKFNTLLADLEGYGLLAAV